MIRRTFASLSRGDYESVLKGVSPRIAHTFGGDHALGGTRHGVEAMRRWFQRLYRLCPGLNFEVKTVAVGGWPWDTKVTVEWTDRANPADGSEYVNEGVHVVKLRWGEVVYLRAYLDTIVVEAFCRRLTAFGVEEANAPPIED